MNPAQKRIHAAALRVFAEKGTTDINVSELAAAAGVARGTIYNQLESPDRLFQSVAGQLADGMNACVAGTLSDIDDPAARIATGMRLYVRRAHEEPTWGRFLVTFGLTDVTLQKVWSGPLLQHLTQALQRKRFDIRSDQMMAALGIITGATLSAIFSVIDGQRTWRDAGSDAAELTLRALGLDAQEARQISILDLPPLANRD